MDKYECEGQMQLFDFIERTDKYFCWDDDINEIVERLKEIAGSYGLEVGKAEFTVWDHVPNLGFRVWFDMMVNRIELKQEGFHADVTELVKHAKSKNVELTPMWGAVMFFTKDEEERARLHFTTMFMDKQRQHRKE